MTGPRPHSIRPLPLFATVLAMLMAMSLLAATAIAAVPITDAARIVKETEVKKNTLNTLQTKRGQSESTEGVACNFKRSKEQVMKERGDVAKKIAQTCQRVGVDQALGLSIAFQESQFNQNCKAPTTPWSGGERATGVMQVLPATASRVGRQYVGRPLDVTNEDDNILAGCLYLKEGARITGGSEYHTITGYHNGYGSRVMRENLPLPAGWKNGLNYGEMVQNRHLPYFRSVLGGGGDPGRFQWDQLQTNIYSASANGIGNIQSNQTSFANRLSEQTGSVGQAPTTIQAWDENSRGRVAGAQVQNNAIDALSILMQLRLVQMMAGNVDTSETAKMLDYQSRVGSGGGTLVQNGAKGEVVRLNPDGSTTRVRLDEPIGSSISVISAAVPSSTSSPATTLSSASTQSYMPAPAANPSATAINPEEITRRLTTIRTLANN